MASLLGGAYDPPNSSFRGYGFPEVSLCNAVTSFTPFPLNEAIEMMEK